MRSIIRLGPLSSLPSFSSIIHASINVTYTICDYRFGDLNAINHKKQKKNWILTFSSSSQLLKSYYLHFGIVWNLVKPWVNLVLIVGVCWGEDLRRRERKWVFFKRNQSMRWKGKGQYRLHNYIATITSPLYILLCEMLLNLFKLGVFLV